MAIFVQFESIKLELWSPVKTGIAMLNEIDKKILAILLRDARATHAQMAEEVGLSRPAIAERIKKLEQAGVIRASRAIGMRAGCFGRLRVRDRKCEPGWYSVPIPRVKKYTHAPVRASSLSDLVSTGC